MHLTIVRLPTGSKLEELRGQDLGDIQCNTDAVCLPNTRQALLSRIRERVGQTDGNRILWLHGNAGSGKSTVANTIASHFDQEGHLGASFQFNREMDGRNTPNLLFRNIAYQLAFFDPNFKVRLLEVINKCTTVAPTLGKQLKLFIVEPMGKITREHPIVIVIDGLDECGEERIRMDALRALAKASDELPSAIKILLTSRNEPDIRAELLSTTFSIDINKVDQIDHDIGIFIDNRMCDVVKRHTHLGEGWPGPIDKRRLTVRAGGLFIWVAVASQYIKQSADPARVLFDVLDGQPGNAENALDKLYLGVMESREIIGCTPDEIKYVVGSILAAKIPLTRVGLDAFLGLRRNAIKILQDGAQIRLTTSASLINALSPILLVSNNKIQFLHPSIIDFFTNRDRCTDRFFIDRSKYNRELTVCCFGTMNTLRRDICAINDPTKFNSEIADIDARLNKCLAEHLRYACVHWGQHLEDVADEHGNVYRLAKEFFFSHLLHWIEVMSLLNATFRIFVSLNQTKYWLQVRSAVLQNLVSVFYSLLSQKHTSCEDDTHQLINDALNLVQRFRVPIQQSAAHVYVSAIPFMSPHSILFRIYSPKLENIPRLISGAKSASSVVLRLEGHHVAGFSPERSRFVYAKYKELEIWDVATGIPIHVPLVGHDSAICYIEFSRDGKRFFSVDEAHCVIVWDAISMRAIGVPIQLSSTHWRIRLFEDKVVTVEKQSALCIWSTVTGELVVKHGVGGFAHPQGAYFTINPGRLGIFMILTGEEVTNKLTHGRPADGAIFSPDNTKVLLQTGSRATLSDVESGNIIGEPVNHGYSSKDFSFAANGRHVIATNRNSISIFDASTGKLTAGPIIREYIIDGAALSFDGTRLVIWNFNNVEVLDIQSGDVINIPTGASKRGCFISPDGNRVIVDDRGSITIYDVALSSTSHNTPSIQSITPSPTARQLLVLLSDDTLLLAVDIYSKPTALPDATSPAAFSPNGSQIVSASLENTLQLWNANDANPVGRRLQGHGEVITAVAFSPNGDRLISASFDGTICIWSATSHGQELLRMRAYSDIWAISLSADESRIICVSKLGIIQMMDACTGHAVSQPSIYNWCWADFSPDTNKIICVSSNGHSRSIDSQTGQVTQCGIGDTYKIRSEKITQVVFSSTKTHFVSISKCDTIGFSDRPTHEFDWNTRFTSSFDGKWIMSVHKLYDSTDRVCMWDLQSRRCIWESLEEAYELPRFSDSGSEICIRGRYTSRVRETASGAIIAEIHNETIGGWDSEAPAPLNSSSATPNDRIQKPVICQHLTLTFHNTITGTDTIVCDVQHHINLLTLSPDGLKVAAVATDGVVYVWDTLTGNSSRTPLHFGGVESLVFSPDGNQLLIFLALHSMQMWNICTNSIVGFDDVDSAAIFPDCSQLLTSSSHINAQIWNISSRSPLLISTSTVAVAKEDEDFLAISSDGTRLLSSSGLWDIVNFRFKELASFHAYIHAVKFSPDCKHIVLIDDKLRIFDAATGALLHQMKYSDATTFSRTIVDYGSSTPRLQRLRYKYLSDIRFSFSVDSKCLCVLKGDHLSTIRGLPTSVNVDSFSCIYPRDCIMMTAHKESLFEDGWYLGVHRIRLIWVPDDVRSVWLETGRQAFRTRHLILGRNVNNITILSMEDYLQGLPIKGAWREGGVRYTRTIVEEKRAETLASATGMLVRNK